MYSSKANTHLSPAASSDKKNIMESPRPPAASPPGQNVAFAVNYSLPSVDQFVAPAERGKTSAKSNDGAKSGPSTPAKQPNASDLPKRTQLVEKDMNRAKSVTIVEPPSSSSTTPRTPAAKRSSRRDRKPREKSREKHRVRYDMNHVPVVRRHDQFVAHHRSQDDDASSALHHRHKQHALPPRRVSARTGKDDAEGSLTDGTCHKCKGEELPAPFVADSSVVWIPTKRTEWEDCLSEMTAVCTSAALRRHVASKTPSTSKPFFAPLSQAYIRDRIDIDDPLEGYQIRHKAGGWLQGFIMWTNFTTWTHYFKWDSLHQMSGIPSSGKVDKNRHVDKDGALSAELETQPRSGDPLATGVVFPTIAEIGLLGGMGCGEYLLRMALDDIKSRGQYKYVVMQATDASRTFYERFGFVRVGAVCRYGMNGTQKAGGPLSGEKVPQAATETDLVGYRHWTYANERNLDTYGGPSYMMALRLPSGDGADVAPPGCPKCASEVTKPTVIEQLKAVAVEEKPKIAQLGAAPTPYKKASAAPLSKPTPSSVKSAPPSSRLSALGATLSPYPPGVRRRGRPPKYWSDMRRSQTPQQLAGAKNKRSQPAKSPHVKPQQQPIAKPAPSRKTPSPQESLVKRGRGRPRKTPSPVGVPGTALPPPRSGAVTNDGGTGKRARGRPRKTPSPQHPAVKTDASPSTPSPPQPAAKRSRGRPRKMPLPQDPAGKSDPSIASPSRRQRKRGRRPPSSSPSKSTPSPRSCNEPKSKRRRTTPEDFGGLDVQREVLMAPPAQGKKLSYCQKQYQSVWLAVPPAKTTPGGRRPPRERDASIEQRKRSAPEQGNDAPPLSQPTTKEKVASPRRSSRLSSD